MAVRVSAVNLRGIFAELVLLLLLVTEKVRPNTGAPLVHVGRKCGRGVHVMVEPVSLNLSLFVQIFVHPPRE